MHSLNHLLKFNGPTQPQFRKCFAPIEDKNDQLTLGFRNNLSLGLMNRKFCFLSENRDGFYVKKKKKQPNKEVKAVIII